MNLSEYAHGMYIDVPMPPDMVVYRVQCGRDYFAAINTKRKLLSGQYGDGTIAVSSNIRLETGLDFMAYYVIYVGFGDEMDAMHFRLAYEDVKIMHMWDDRLRVTLIKGKD